MAYISEFEKEETNSDESRKTLQDSMQHWLEVFKFPTVEETTYDRAECTANNQIYPILGDKIAEDITAGNVKNLLSYWMNKGYAFSTVKKVEISGIS